MNSSHQPRLRAVTIPKTPAAILWDMDGTLIDSEPYWIDAETSLAARFGVPWTYDDGLTLVGNSLEVSAHILMERGVRLSPEEIITTMVNDVAARAADHMPWLQDARDLLSLVLEAKIPCALVTMSIGPFVAAFLESAGPVFSAVVTGDDVAHGKPHPEAYLSAAALLGVDARDCLAIEDSPSGTRAAVSSGATTIGVRRHADLPQLEGMSRCASLTGLTVESLTRIHGGQIRIDEGV